MTELIRRSLQSVVLLGFVLAGSREATALTAQQAPPKAELKTDPNGNGARVPSGDYQFTGHGFNFSMTRSDRDDAATGRATDDVNGSSNGSDRPRGLIPWIRRQSLGIFGTGN